MKKVITYGTYDLLHYGHINLLERARELGDYLIVGVTSDSFDRARGKINVSQTLSERIEAVKATGLADEIIVEEYEGQKIDDIKRYGVDVFTVGSDWEGYFDYLKAYCDVVYLERTKGISSTQLRSTSRHIKLGLVGDIDFLDKVAREDKYVNGVDVVGICTTKTAQLTERLASLDTVTEDYDELLENVDAVYLISNPQEHYKQIKQALLKGKHVLCASPVCMTKDEFEELETLASSKHLILMDALRTAFSMAYSRLLLLVKSGRIGEVVSIDATCTSLRDLDKDNVDETWNSICSWGPTAMLPVFQLLGDGYISKQIVSYMADEALKMDAFTKVDFIYPSAVASIKVGKGVKSEGELIISGTKGYIYVPAPWWKTDYFEVRYENPANNKRYFYQLDGEGIRYMLVSFARDVNSQTETHYVERETSLATIGVIKDFYDRTDMTLIG